MSDADFGSKVTVKTIVCVADLQVYIVEFI